MPDFKIGDKVALNDTPDNRRYLVTQHQMGLTLDSVLTVKRTDAPGRDQLLYFMEVDGGMFAKRFHLKTPEKALPLTTVLKMDREIAKAGGAPGILEEYLDRPLSDFVQNVMAPNKLTLKFG